MVEKPRFLQFENVFQLALSIMLAAAVAHALNILSLGIIEDEWWIWLFSSIIIGVSIVVIFYILGFFEALKQVKNKDENRIFWLKILILWFVTIDIFAFTRYIYFLTNPDVTIKVSGISLLLTIILTIILGVILIIQSRFDKKNRQGLFWFGLILTVVSGIIYIIIYMLSRSGANG